MSIIKYPLAKETINSEDIDALCVWLKSYPRLTKGSLTWKVEEDWANYIGTEYAVMLKNIYAIAAGIAHGLGYGDNFQSVLMSNAIREMKRFIKKVDRA